MLDANVLIALCAREQDIFSTAKATFDSYLSQGWWYYAPAVLLAETLYILCGKLQSGELTPASHAQALQLLQQYLLLISPPPSGDFALAARAEAIRQSYGCSRRLTVCTLPWPRNWRNKARLSF